MSHVKSRHRRPHIFHRSAHTWHAGALTVRNARLVEDYLEVWEYRSQIRISFKSFNAGTQTVQWLDSTGKDHSETLKTIRTVVLA